MSVVMEEELKRLCYKAEYNQQPGRPIAGCEPRLAGCLIFDSAFLDSPGPVVSTCNPMTGLRRPNSQARV